MPVPDVMWLNMTTRVRGVIAPANMETTPSGPFPSASSKCQFLYHHAMPLGAQPKTADPARMPFSSSSTGPPVGCSTFGDDLRHARLGEIE